MVYYAKKSSSAVWLVVQIRRCGILNWHDVYDVWERVTTVSSIPLALAGFGITIWQLVKTRDAATAAQQSAVSVVRQVRRMSLLGLLPQLQRVEEEMDKAVRADSVELLLAWLSIWRWQAGEIRGRLSSRILEERKVMRAIQASMTVAAEVKVELTTNQQNDLGAALLEGR